MLPRRQDGDTIETCHPDAAEAIEAFLQVLANIYPRQAIGNALVGPLDMKLYAGRK